MFTKADKTVYACRAVGAAQRPVELGPSMTHKFNISQTGDHGAPPLASSLLETININ